MSDKLKVTFTHIDANGNEVEIGHSSYKLNDMKADQVSLENEVKIAAQHIESHLKNIKLI